MKITSLLISQPKPVVLEKSPFYELLSKYKIAADFVPFIKVQGVEPKEFRSQRVDILAHSAVIFTSRATIDSFFNICEKCRITVSEEMKYFCVTEAIALYLQKYIIYRKRKIFFGKGSFADLMDIVVKHKEEKFLVALSDPHKPEIPKALEKAKIKHDNVILSRTVPSDFSEKISDITKYDMLVFYSPVEITSFVEKYGTTIPAEAKIATFGPATAQTAINAGLNVCVLAPTKESPSMVAAIDKYIAAFNKGEVIDTSYIGETIKNAVAQNEQVIAKAKQLTKPKRTTATTKSGGATIRRTAPTEKKSAKTSA